MNDDLLKIRETAKILKTFLGRKQWDKSVKQTPKCTPLYGLHALGIALAGNNYTSYFKQSLLDKRNIG